ncbi:MAG: hypothetical protein ACI37J_04615 [Candidatus Bruticola sp.]
MDSLPSAQEKSNITESGAVSFKIYEQLRAEIQHLKQELVSVSEQNVDLAIQLGQIDELNGVVAERNSQIERLNQEAVALNKTITDLTQQLSHETEHAQKSDMRIEELLALEAELRADLKQSQEECLDLKAQIERHLASIASLQEALAQAQASNARHVAALESLEAYISKPEEQEDKEDTPPLLHLKNALHEILGTAGQVIFSRACRLVGADAKNLANTTPEQLQKAAISIISPALRLCRGEQMIKNLQERIRSICASVGEISPELEDALNGSSKTIAVVSSTSATSKNNEPVATVPTEQTVQNISEEEKKEENTTPVPTVPEEEIAKADTSDIDTEEDEEAKEEEEKEETSTKQPSSAQDDKQTAPKDDDSADASAAEETKEEATSEEEPEEEPELSIFAHYDYEYSDTEEEAADQNSAVSSSDEQTEANKEQTQEVATEQDTESAEEAKSEAVQQSEVGEVVEKAEDNSDTHENLDKGSSKSSKSVGDQLVRNTEVPNRTLSDKRAQEFNTTFKTILDGTQTKFQDHVVDLIYKMTWTPSQISERDRACTRPKQINKLSQSIIRSSVDFDLDQIIEWLNYLVMPKRINTYVPEERLAQLSDIRTRQDSEVQDLLNIIEALNKRIFRKDRLKIYFFDGPYMYLSYTKSKEPHLYFNNEIVSKFNQAQQTFFAARALFSLQRGYFELEAAWQAVTNQPDYDPLVFGSTLLKRSLALASEKSIAIPANLANEIQNAWNIESNQELLNLVDRCYKSTKFAQFSYIKELLSTSTPFQQSMNIEGDAFTLKFCNIYDASLAIVTLLSGSEVAQQYAQEGFNELFSDRSLPQTYLQQRLSNLWLSYYINGDEFAF